MKAVLLVIGDPVLRQALAEQLRRGGEFDVAVAGAAAEGCDLARATPFDAIILDSQDPATLPVIREAAGGGPALLLLVPPDAAPENTGPEAPVDGVAARLARPFRLADLLAQLRALPEQANGRPPAGGEAPAQAGPWHFHKSAKTLRHAGRNVTVSLTEKEAEILACLHQARGETVRRDRLLSEVWGYGAAIATHTVETHVYRLRQKIAAAVAGGEALIQTRPEGYALQVAPTARPPSV